ncbi:MAG: hypothetical protein IPG01_18365 [Chitinophagaceae bacterium]|nr:hypothetical protein [Chitinophagaceae bacterium]
MILLQKKQATGNRMFRSLLNGVVEQNKGYCPCPPSTLKTVTNASPTPARVGVLLFAEKCVKHLKSNTIVLARDKRWFGMGCGQTSRMMRQTSRQAKARKNSDLS